MAALLLRLSLLLLLQQCAVTQTATSSSLAGRAAFATISTQNGTAPRFPCTSSASLVFKPRAALAARLLQAGAEPGRCWLFGANAAGEYILSPGKELPRLLIKAIAEQVGAQPRRRDGLLGIVEHAKAAGRRRMGRHLARHPQLRCEWRLH